MIAAAILYRAVAVTVDLFLILLALGLLSWAAREAGRTVLRFRARRKDREWFAHVAAKPRGPELLAWLREQRAAGRRRRCVRPVPRAGAELKEWEREEIDRTETFYADNGADPYGKQPRRSS